MLARGARTEEAVREWRLAEDLGISYNGIRYRIGRIFDKLAVRNRHDAIRKARALGILPAEDTG